MILDGEVHLIGWVQLIRWASRDLLVMCWAFFILSYVRESAIHARLVLLRFLNCPVRFLVEMTFFLLIAAHYATAFYITFNLIHPLYLKIVLLGLLSHRAVFQLVYAFWLT
jgi:hypothetical protein